MKDFALTDSTMTLLDAIESAVFVLEVGDDGRPVYRAFNRFAREAAGRKLDDVVGRTALEVYPTRHGVYAYGRHLQVLRTGKQTTYELNLPLKGALRTVRTTLRPLLDGAGSVNWVIGSSADISDERAAREAWAGAETVAHDIEAHFNLAARDLRSPMRQIRVLTQLIRKEGAKPNGNTQDLLDLLQDVTDNTADLISDLLNHADAAYATESGAAFDLAELAANILVTLDPSGRHTVRCAPVELQSDKTAVQIILRNLVENAFKHGGESKIEVEIAACSIDPNVFEISIQDNGVGFSAEALKAFGDDGLRSGVGVGLSGVSRLVRARGGEIVAIAKPHAAGGVVKVRMPGRAITAAGEAVQAVGDQL